MSAIAARALQADAAEDGFSRFKTWLYGEIADRAGRGETGLVYLIDQTDRALFGALLGELIADGFEVSAPALGPGFALHVKWGHRKETRS